MELLPLMLQAALLLFSCALSRYLWEINRTIASVLLGVTSFGALSYILIIIAGAAFDSCPYQTPGAHILRHHLLPALRSSSYCYKTPAFWWEWMDFELWYSPGNVILSLMCIIWLPIALVIDISLLGRAILRSLIALSITAYHSAPFQMPDPDQQTILLDLRCVSWMLHTSLDKGFLLTAFQYLMTMAELACSDPSLIFGCFNIFTSCVKVTNGMAVMVQGMEKLAEPSATFFFRTLRHLLSTDPTSSTLVDLYRRYRRLFPPLWEDFEGLPIRYTTIAIHIWVHQILLNHIPVNYIFHIVTKSPRQWRWFNEDRPSAEEHIQLAECIAEVAKAARVPRWTLRFACDSLSLDPPPPPAAVADCLKIIAYGLEFGRQSIMAPDMRCVRI